MRNRHKEVRYFAQGHKNQDEKSSLSLSDSKISDKSPFNTSSRIIDSMSMRRCSFSSCACLIASGNLSASISEHPCPGLGTANHNRLRICRRKARKSAQQGVGTLTS